MLKSFFVISDCLRVASFVPTWTVTHVMEEGSDCSRPRSLSNKTGTVSPEKQCVTVLGNLIFLTIEYPTNNIVGGKTGQKGDDCLLTRQGASW